MLEINSLVVYGANGVCRVEDLREENLSGIKRMFYILKPLGIKNSTFYIPADSKPLLEKVHKLMSADEIVDLINEMPQEDTVWIDDDRARTAQYKAMLSSGDRRQLVKLTKTLYQRKNELECKGKKLRASDEAIMKNAEQLLFEEFALVLGIPQEEVLPFILKSIQ